MKKSLTVHKWLTKVINMDVYFKMMKGIAIKEMKSIRRHPQNIIDVDTKKIVYDSDDDNV